MAAWYPACLRGRAKMNRFETFILGCAAGSLFTLSLIMMARPADLPLPKPRPAASQCAPISDAGKTRDGFALVWDGTCPAKLRWVKQ